jgi:protein SCO1/2
MALGKRLQARAAALVGRPLFWVLFLSGLTAWPIARSIRAERQLPQNRPVMGTVRDFSLVDQNGDVFGSSELRGVVWVAHFSSTQCRGACGEMLDRMSNLQHRTRNLGEGFRIVTVSVDPERDDAAKMKAFAFSQRASRRLWRFLAGPAPTVERLLEDFKVARHVPQTRFALVDGAGQIRGYYDLSDKDSLNLLVRDVGLMVSRGY